LFFVCLTKHGLPSRSGRNHEGIFCTYLVGLHIGAGARGACGRSGNRGGSPAGRGRQVHHSVQTPGPGENLATPSDATTDEPGTRPALRVRLYNAGFIVREVQKLAKDFHESTTPDKGHAWFDFVHQHEGNGYEPKCCNDNLTSCCLWAEHFSYCWASTNLCVAWGFQRGAANRSNTLVHEATHDDVGHVSDDSCSNGASCDDWYGNYNATTMQINYSYDAAAAYLTETVNNAKQRKVLVFQDSGKQMCGYVALLADSERDSLLADAVARLNNNFASGSVFPLYTDSANVDSAKGTPWECANCETADYTFAEQTYGNNKACNELTNKGNVAVNASMRASCQAFNQSVGSASGAAAYGKIKHDLSVATSGKCLACSEKDTAAYCDSRKASTATVASLDPYGIISSCGYTFEDECTQEYCHKKFDGSWAAHAGDANWSEPRGCLDAVCGNDPVCRKRYLNYGGDPTYYQASGCLAGLLDCYDQHGFTIPGKGAHPSPTEIAECTAKEQLCEALEAARRKLAGYILVSKWVHPGDPVTHSNPWERTSQEVLLGQLAQLKADFAAKRATQAQFEERLARLMGNRTSQAVFFSLQPRTYVSLFGRAGLEKIAAPAQRSVEAETIAVKSLPARARVIMKQFEALKARTGAVTAPAR
jgi:hypothetical protein